MLQQTQVARVIPRLAEWLERWPTPSALAAEAPGEAVRAWDRLGYPRRALRLHAAATAIAERHGDVVPDDVDALLALPGIGEYTARAVAAFAYGVRVPVVDTNVRRVLARAVAGQGEAGPPSTRRDLADMEALLPVDAAEARITNAAVMELGAVVCLPRTPRCDVCPIAAQCAWRQAGYPPYLDRAAPASRASRAPTGRCAASSWPPCGAVTFRCRPARSTSSGTTPRQLDRALRGLVADGLVIDVGDGFELPRR